MRRSLILVLLLAGLVTARAFADVTIPIHPKDNEWIGASVIEDDGSGAIVVASAAPRQSRIIRFDRRGQLKHSRIAGISVNTLQPLGGDRYFIRGGVGSGDEAHYAARIIDLSSGATLWDSASLGAAVSRNENAVASVDDTGVQWVALVPSQSIRFSLLFGKVPASDPAMKYHFESQATFRNVPSSDFTGGSWDLAVLGTRGGDTHAAVLTPHGSIYIVSAADGVKSILNPERGGGHLMWEPSAQTLWVESADAWSAFPLGDLLARRKARTAKPSSARPALTTSFERKTAGAAAAFPLTGGRFALRTRNDAASAVEIFTTPSATPQIVLLPDVSTAGVVKVSPSGRAILALPTGPRSNAAVIRIP